MTLQKSGIKMVLHGAKTYINSTNNQVSIIFSVLYQKYFKHGEEWNVRITPNKIILTKKEEGKNE